jgi:3-oxoacyl-[acyl-carrier protein] reductase
VNNAGVSRDGLLARQSAASWREVMATNLDGLHACCQAAVRPMMRARYGRIVNLSSIVGLRGNPGQTAYATSKAGILGFTKSLAKELARRNITVNAVAPGFIETDMTREMPEAARAQFGSAIAIGRPGSPEEVAAAVAFLASAEASYITGAVLEVTGGLAL